MKKIFLSSVILFCFCNLVAQNNYYLEVNADSEFWYECYKECPNGINSPGCSYDANCTLLEEFNSELIIYDINNNVLDSNLGTGDFQLQNQYKGLFSVKPHRIVFDFDYVEIIDASDNTVVQEGEYSIILDDTDPCFLFVQQTDGDYGIWGSLYDSSRVLNNPTINPCNNFGFSLSAHNDCRYYSYNWKYSTDGTSFSDLNATTTGTDNEYIDFDTFLPIGYLGNLFIKADISYDGGATYIDSTNIIIYIIDSCSPQITGFASQDTNCSDSNDGGFTVTFDRPLNTDELLTTVNLYNDGPDGIINNADDIQFPSLFDQTYTGTTYIWPNPLPADNYRLEYQSGGSGSLEEYFPIVINSPTAVTFNATWTDVDCYGANTGSISINADGGTGIYEYSIDDGVNWLPFSNTDMHTVINLPATTYQVKVKDSNDCIAQQ